MASTADIRNGSVIFHKKKRFKIIEFQHVKPGKGGAFVRTKLKDIQSGKNIDETFNAGTRLEFVRVDAKKMQFLYQDNDLFVFMDNDTYDQLNIDADTVADNMRYLIAGLNVDVLFDGTEILDIRLPANVVLNVVETEPGFKGNTATGATKPATVETGYSLNVPLFIEEGDSLKINTTNGEYIERAKI
ncbi:uncharacterized protein METZ01_LOCUS62285 [marine metagenome]|uniref:Elongation factor P C-terminal domain-containing protein n=1 Tax=marine metagenome TaxID=408172 RepID=A0A381T1L2_9ZZZZ